MPKSTKAPAKPAKRAAAKSAARNTDSGPSQVTAAIFDANSKKMAQTQDLVAAMPDNEQAAFKSSAGVRQQLADQQFLLSELSRKYGKNYASIQVDHGQQYDRPR